MIIVTGASGQLGRAIVEQLLARVDADQLGVSVRDPTQVREFAERGVRVRHGDFTNDSSLDHAFEGASQVLIVSAATTGGEAINQHRTAIDRAKAAGAQRILYTSHQAASRSSVFAPMPDHVATETLLRDSGTAFTSLRNGFYASTTVRLLGDAMQSGELRAPEDGPVSWTAHRDLAEMAAIAVAGDGDGATLDGISPPLTGAEAIDLSRVAGIVSELSGRSIRRVIVSDDEFKARLVEHGVPARAADMLVGMFRASRRGEFATVDGTLADLLGRPTTSLRDVLQSVVS